MERFETGIKSPYTYHTFKEGESGIKCRSCDRVMTVKEWEEKQRCYCQSINVVEAIACQGAEIIRIEYPENLRQENIYSKSLTNTSNTILNTNLITSSYPNYSQGIKSHLFSWRWQYFGCFIFLITGVGLTLHSPHIPLVCNQLDNCARDKNFQQQYTKFRQQGDNSLKLAEQAKTLTELKNARNDLQKNLTNFNTIPQDVKIYPQSQQTLNNYQKELQNLDEKISDKQTRQKQLEEIEKLKNSTIEQTKKAKTINEYQQAKTQWQEIEKELAKMPLDGWNSKKIKTEIEEAKNQQQILQKLEQLSIAAQPKPAPLKTSSTPKLRRNYQAYSSQSRTKVYPSQPRTKAYTPQPRTKVYTSQPRSVPRPRKSRPVSPSYTLPAPPNAVW